MQRPKTSPHDSTSSYTYSTAPFLPLGSSLTLPIHLQNEHAHMFAENIEGLEVGILQSHPRVVSVQLDHYNQTMTLVSLGSGDCNVVLYLVERDPDAQEPDLQVAPCLECVLRSARCGAEGRAATKAWIYPPKDDERWRAALAANASAIG